MLLMLFLAFSFQTSFAQVTLTATSGTATGSFTTLKGAFDAINLGTHKGVIEIKINANTTETASASLTASAALATSAPFYTSITVYPTATGLSITGALAAPLINLNGADNVTIDGRVNATGSTMSLTISNTSAVATAGTSTIRFIADASSNTVKYCTLKGSTTDAAAGIVFFSTATTTGNDNNTITNNDITCAADASRPLNAVYALGTTLKNNDNNTISNNNIYNVLSKATASQGVNVSSYNTAFTISGNSFYETASFSPSAAVNYNVILISAATGTGNGFTVSDNYIGGSAALCAGTAWTKPVQNNAFTAISVTTATGTANSIQGNTIQNFNWTNAGTSDFTGISLTGTTVANIGTITGNTIGAETGTGSITFTSTTTATDFYGINIASTDVVNCQNNIIGSITVANAATNATNFYGIYKSATAGTTNISNNTIGSTTTANSINASSASSTAANIQSVYGIQSLGTGTVTIDGNTIANMVNATSNATTTAAGLISGIYVSAGTNTISGNTVRNLSNANANNSITNTASVSGIVLNYITAATQTVSGNTVHSLSNSFSTFAGGVIGIYYNGSTTASMVSRNFIHSLSVTGASSTTADLYGIKIAAGTTTYSNNIISLGGDTKTDLFGIFQTGAASNNNSLYFNTIYIAGSMVTGSTNTSYALFSTATTNTRDFRNNVLVNARFTVSGASKHYAMWIAASGGTITCNYNNYYVSGTGGVLGYFAADKTALPIVTSNDANSIVTNPTFSSAGGTTATDYTPTVQGTGAAVNGITVDYAGNTRATNVTMGAYELRGVADAPTNLVATAGLNKASIAFLAPTNVGGGAITNYQYSLDNGANWLTLSPAQNTSPVLIKNLISCNSNSISLRTVNAIGNSVSSEAVIVRPQNGQQLGDWTPIATAGGLNSWASVTYGNGKFVAVGRSNSDLVKTSSDGINWTSTNTSLFRQWQSVTYGNDVFVAVGAIDASNASQVMTSSDGINWTGRTQAANNNWTSVTYGNNLFVAVANSGTGNRVMTSPDGIIWTSRTSALDYEWQSVTYGNGVFVAVAFNATGTGNWVMTSPDGTTWTSRTTPKDQNWQSVTYGNGIFVAVSPTLNKGEQVMTSYDGINWTLRSSTPKSWISVAYGDGLFVAITNTFNNFGPANTIMTSPDGAFWTARNGIGKDLWQCLAYGNGLFVSLANTLQLGTAGNEVMTSGDALSPSSPVIKAITAAANYVSVDFEVPASIGFSAISKYEYSINNGSTWVSTTPDLPNSSFKIEGLTTGTSYAIQLRALNGAGASCASATVNTKTLNAPEVPNEPTQLAAEAGLNAAFISFSSPSNDGGANITNYEYTINDGKNWTAIASNTSPLYIKGLDSCTEYSIKIRAVNLAGGGLPSVAVLVTAKKGSDLYESISLMRMNNAGNSSSVVFGNGIFVAVAYQTNITTNKYSRVLTSSNGLNWANIPTQTSSVMDNAWRSVTYGNGTFVAVASSGFGTRVMTSQDGTNWRNRQSPADNSWNSVTYGNGLFVAVASTGTGDRVMTSTDGIAWTSRNAAIDDDWQSVSYGNGRFVAVANSGNTNSVMTSTDGINWTAGTVPSGNNWISVTYGNGRFVAVASAGIVNQAIMSLDGITWTVGQNVENNSWNSVSFGNGFFVAVSSTGTKRAMKSPDGINWTPFTITSLNWGTITFGNNRFIILSKVGADFSSHTVLLNLAAPSAPTINTITPDSTSASVAFTPLLNSTNDFNTNIYNYEYSIDNGSNWVTPFPQVTTSPITITGLTSGTTYDVQLRAVNRGGSGCASASVKTTLSSLGTNTPVFDENSVIVYKNKGLIQIKSSEIALANVKVYDLLGRLIQEKTKVNANETSIDVSRLANQVLIVKITGENNAILTKKILN